MKAIKKPEIKLKTNEKFLLVYVLFLIAAALVVFFMRNMTGYIVAGILAVLPLIYLLFTKVLFKKDSGAEHVDEFIHMFSYFKIYISNNLTVYEALNEIKKYGSIWFQEQLDVLLNEIDSDKTVLPFINFSKKFPNSIIEEIMITIYQMIDEGSNIQSIESFSYVFDEFKKTSEQVTLEKFDKSLANKMNFCLLGAALFTLSIMIGVINLLGAGISGI